MKIDWDEWRATYPTSTFAEQAAFYGRIAPTLKPQQCWKRAVKSGILNRALEDARFVVELGPWTGELAAHCLDTHPGIIHWVGFDLCGWAIDHGLSHPRYVPLKLVAHPWETLLPGADVFVASHVLEHITWDQLGRLNQQFPKYRRLYLDIPVPDTTRPDWRGYNGSHILDASWEMVDELVRSHGFSLVERDGTARVYHTT